MQKHLSYKISRKLFDAGVRLITEHSYLQSKWGIEAGIAPSLIAQTWTEKDAEVRRFTIPAPDLSELIAALPENFEHEPLSRLPKGIYFPNLERQKQSYSLRIRKRNGLLVMSYKTEGWGYWQPPIEGDAVDVAGRLLLALVQQKVVSADAINRQQ